MSSAGGGPGPRPDDGTHPDVGIEVFPVVAVSRIFRARPSSIPDIREFVRGCLARSPLTAEETRQVDDTVVRALLDAAGATGAVQVVFRIFPDHAEVDILRSTSDEPPQTPAATAGAAREHVGPPHAGGQAPDPPASFADWMAQVLADEGLSREAAARQLGVSVKTVARWVGGETEPRLRDLRRIREVFGRTPFV